MNILLCTLAYLLFGAVIAAAVCIAAMLNTAMALIFLHGYRGEEVEVSQLFDCFCDGKTAKHVLGGMLWMDLWILIWSLIPFVGVIFGTIRAYEYRLTPYILMMEPDIPATEAIKVSKARTEGWKGKMFGADILYVALVFAASLILTLFAHIPFLGVLFGLADFVLCVCVALFSSLFVGLVHAAFYEEITNPSTTGTADASASSAPKADAFCPHCGAPVSKDHSFCPACGSSLKTETHSEPAPDASPAADEKPEESAE